MHTPDEELASLPERQYATAQLRCAACRPYHALWPIMRVSRQVGGVEADEPFLGPLLAELVGRAPRHIALAGSADSGVLAMVNRATCGAGLRHRFTVVDRCATPFDACRLHAHRHGIELQTLQAQLREFPDLRADLILGHSVLPFVPIADRHETLCALHRALAPGGRLILTTRIVAADRDRDKHQRQPDQWVRQVFDNVRAGMRNVGVELPCTEDELHAMVSTWVTTDAFHVAMYERAEDLQRDLEAAGFTVERMTTAGRGTEYMKDGRVNPTGKQGVVAVTAPKR